MLFALAKRLFRIRWAVFATLVVTVWQVYVHFWPQLEPMDEPREQVAQDAAWQLVDQLPSLPGQPSLLVPPLEGDEDDFVSRTFGKVVNRSGKFKVLEESAWRTIGPKVGIPPRPPTSAAEALELGRKAEAQYVLFGRIGEFRSDRSLGELQTQVEIWSVKESKPLVEPIQVSKTSTSGGTLAGVLGVIGVWVVSAAALPWLTFGIVRKIIDTESNSAILLGLLAYGLAGGILAGLYGFLGGHESSIIAATVLGFGATFAYSYGVFSVIERQTRAY